MKRILGTLMTVASLFAAGAYADLCDNASGDGKAKAALAKIVAAAENDGKIILVSSSGVQECNPTSVLLASLNPGERAPRIMFPNVCGAIFTFKAGRDDRKHAFAHWLLANPSLAGAARLACVSTDVARR